MTTVVFYEKPGCTGNRRQRALLEAHGVDLRVENLLTAAWRDDDLRAFFGELPVVDWFNTSAPRVKHGEIDIHACDERQALALMAAEPLLIRRPLLRRGDARQAGFVDGPVLAALGIRLASDLDLASCPMSGSDPVCEAPA